MSDPTSRWTSFFIKKVHGYLFYRLPRSTSDWYAWEKEMLERDCKGNTMVFEDGDVYWAVDCVSTARLVEGGVQFLGYHDLWSSLEW